MESNRVQENSRKRQEIGRVGGGCVTKDIFDTCAYHLHTREQLSQPRVFNFGTRGLSGGVPVKRSTSDGCQVGKDTQIRHVLRPRLDVEVT